MQGLYRIFSLISLLFYFILVTYVGATPTPATTRKPLVPLTTVASVKVNNGSVVSDSQGRVKRGYRSGHSTGIAYNRINDSGQQKDYGHGHGEQRRRSAVGEDGTHIHDFKSYGVGYEHR